MLSIAPQEQLAQYEFSDSRHQNLDGGNEIPTLCIRCDITPLDFVSRCEARFTEHHG
jgi:hypothetical protein